LTFGQFILQLELCWLLCIFYQNSKFCRVCVVGRFDALLVYDTACVIGKTAGYCTET